MDTFGEVSWLIAMSFPDFSATDAQIQWQRFCDLLWYHDDLGMWLDISRMDLNSSQLDDLSPRLQKAFEAMKALENGAIVNADENRQVGHYWLRHPQLAPDPAVAQHIAAEIDGIEQFDGTGWHDSRWVDLQFDDTKETWSTKMDKHVGSSSANWLGGLSLR